MNWRWLGLSRFRVSTGPRKGGDACCVCSAQLRVVRAATPKNFRRRRVGRLGGPRSSKSAAHDGETIPKLNYGRILFGMRHLMGISSVQQASMRAEGSRRAVLSSVGCKILGVLGYTTAVADSADSLIRSPNL